jgi:hypothetical protein
MADIPQSEKCRKKLSVNKWSYIKYDGNKPTKIRDAADQRLSFMPTLMNMGGICRGTAPQVQRVDLILHSYYTQHVRVHCTLL